MFGFISLSHSRQYPSLGFTWLVIITLLRLSGLYRHHQVHSTWWPPGLPGEEATKIKVSSSPNFSASKGNTTSCETDLCEAERKLSAWCPNASFMMARCAILKVVLYFTDLQLVCKLAAEIKKRERRPQSTNLGSPHSHVQ